MEITSFEFGERGVRGQFLDLFSLLFSFVSLSKGCHNFTLLVSPARLRWRLKSWYYNQRIVLQLRWSGEGCGEAPPGCLFRKLLNIKKSYYFYLNVTTSRNGPVTRGRLSYSTVLSAVRYCYPSPFSWGNGSKCNNYYTFFLHTLTPSLR